MGHTQSHVSCGPGWQRLYQPIIDLCDAKGVEVLQVKEKFGLLNICIGGEGAEELQLIVSAAEGLSGQVCEQCGVTAWARQNVGDEWVSYGVETKGNWRLTLCEACRTKKDERNP